MAITIATAASSTVWACLRLLKRRTGSAVHGNGDEHIRASPVNHSTIPGEVLSRVWRDAGLEATGCQPIRYIYLAPVVNVHERSYTTAQQEKRPGDVRLKAILQNGGYP